MSFLDVNVIHEKEKFTTSVYRKPTFRGSYNHFDSFLPSSNKIGLLHTLSYRCFRICSDWTDFTQNWTKFGLSFTQNVFKNNDYPENFISNCFKVFLDGNKYRIQEKVITVPKKYLFLVLPYLGPLLLQTRTKLRKSLKDVLNCYKLHRFCLEVKTNQQMLFILKVVFLKNLYLVSFINFNVDSAVNPVMVNV